MDTLETFLAVRSIDEAQSALFSADRETLVLFASRYLAEEWRKRERSAARRDETTATARRERASRAVIERAGRIASAIAEKATTDWAALIDRGAAFTLPSGERVMWAAATIEQHEARALSLEVMAAGDLQTAALHREAVSTIREADVPNLDQYLVKWVREGAS